MKLQETLPADGLRRGPSGQLLNGCYYEHSSRQFVSYVQGRRYYEFDGKNLMADWKERIKNYRAID
ncbi:hypothetical protein [Paenibacillus lacisoli]|nr:hypothetical protein [Paenibacillus sp. JX-17]